MEERDLIVSQLSKQIPLLKQRSLMAVKSAEVVLKTKGGHGVVHEVIEDLLDHGYLDEHSKR